MTSSLQGDSFYNNPNPVNYGNTRRSSQVARYNTSEPNLNIANVGRRMSRDPQNLRNQSVSISNRYIPGQNECAGPGSNQIILKSSFSDQNLQNSIVYEQSNAQSGNISISNVYDRSSGMKNQTITCIRNNADQPTANNIRYTSNQEGMTCEFSGSAMQFRSSIGSLTDLHSSGQSYTNAPMIAAPQSNRIDYGRQHIEEYETDSKLSKQQSNSKTRVSEIKGDAEHHSSSESIKSIIEEVRMELLQKPKQSTYLSDESPTFLNRSHSFSDGELSRNQRVRDNYDKYEFIEGRKHYIIKEDKLKYSRDDRERDYDYEDDRAGPSHRGRRGASEHRDDKRSSEPFLKCGDRRSSTMSEDGRAGQNDSEDEVSDDDVFESPFSRGRNSSFNGKSSSKRRSRYDTRRTSSLEDLKRFIANQQEKDAIASSRSDTTRHSSVSINEKPEYFEYSKSPSSPRPKSSGRSANNASNRSKSSNGIALLQTEPKRTSLKKSTTTSSSVGVCGGSSSSIAPKHGTARHRPDRPKSDYDMRDRGRYGGRDAYRQRDRDRNNSDHERDRDLSDREQRESRERAELDRSLSNNEGTPEDKIDGSLSDTAVIQSLDSRRKLDQRSPKSETPTRDRDRFGAGMGKKSSSTSQLSATDQGISPSSSSSTSTQRKRSSAGSIQRSVEVTPTPSQSAAYRAGSLHSISSSEGSSEPFAGCILQVTVWGDYGRMEGKKVFMGVAQIMLDNLNLSHIVIGWYKLFGTTSLVSGPPSLGLSRRSSIASLDSLKL
ncbi:hypothetical protein pipiens_011790 [Culex pipiens pipiens]|uniref:Regulating synaptic membrane exocytosis protein 2 n=1 Tax=Culex pipiens pipiens TaxID=38569 RepID=A0ABD1D5L0_CULPP